MPEATDRYTATRLSAELGLDNRKMRDILTRVNPVQVPVRCLDRLKAPLLFVVQILGFDNPAAPESYCQI